MKLLQMTPKCVLRLYFKAMKVLLVCVFLISKTRRFLNITSIKTLEQFAIFDAFSKILKNGSIDLYKTLIMYLMVLTILFQSFINIDEGGHSNLRKSFVTKSRYKNNYVKIFISLCNFLL